MKTGNFFLPVRQRILLVLFIFSLSVARAAAGLPVNGSGDLEGPSPVRPFTVSYSRLTRIDARVNYQLACLAARMRLYPLAMRLFRHSLSREKRQKAGEGDALVLPLASMDEERKMQDDQTLVMISHQPSRSPRISPAIQMDKIISRLSDTANAGQFAIIIHVKQPTYGQRRIFKGLGNVGHSFITLIRFNGDGSFTAQSFGLYPKKNYPLAGSPFFPVTRPIFRDDTDHEWDEMVGKYIPKKTYLKLLQVMSTYKSRRYNLSTNNCTDFALTMGDLSGISFTDTEGSWPFGHGQNPACLGQSILSGKFSDSPTAPGEDAAAGNLFVNISHDH